MSIVSDVRAAFGSAPEIDGEYGRIDRAMKIYGEMRPGSG